jgi:tripartite-type tricarboxylate transporter receptor subunit TctC
MLGRHLEKTLGVTVIVESKVGAGGTLTIRAAAQLQASMAILGGHVMTAETGTGTPAWMAGKNDELKILATPTPGGLAPSGMPNVPTLEKLGADYIVRIFYGYAVRAATPTDRVEKLRVALKQNVQDREVRQQMKTNDLTPEWIDPKTFGATLRKVTDDGVKLYDYLKK